MAWNKESKASRRARVAKQLRDKHGKWIEMGGGVKWHKDGKWHNGTASAFKGNNVEVTMEDGSKVLVNHREIEPIRAKGSLAPGKPAKPTGSVQAKKSSAAGKKSISVRDNDATKRLTTNADELEEGDEVHLVGKDKPSYGISDADAAKQEDDGFDVNLDDKDEPIRARVVDTSGDKVVVEDSAGKRHEIDKKDNVLADDPEVDAVLQNADEVDSKASLKEDLPLDGLDLSEDDKKKINGAKSGEEALKALKDSDAGDYLPLARQNKNKAFVDAYRKAVNDINDKHQVVAKKEAEAPAEKKSEGTPVESLQKTLENLNEDLGDIDENGLDGEAEAEAIKDATYDFKSDSGEVFNLNGSRDENGDWNIAVSDSDGNVVANHNPKDAKSSQELAQAIKNSVEDKSSSEESDAPSKGPEAPEDKPEADQAEKNTEVPTGTFEERINSKGVRDQVKSILDDAFENNNSEIQSVDLGDGKALEIRKGGRKGKDGNFEVEGVEISIRDADKVGNTSKTTDRLGTRSFNKKLSNKSSDEVLDEIAAEAKTGEENGQIFGDNSPQRKEWLEKSQKERIAADDAKRKTEKESNKAPLDKALKDAGFSDDDIEKIKNAENETEAEKEFFQSESGKKASDKQIADKKTSPEYEKARKAFEDFKNEKFETGKEGSDEKVKQNQEDQKRREQEDSPEARAERAKETIDSGKKRDADRAAKNTPEAKLAELDRKIAAGEKMLKDAEKKENAPLAKRLSENIDSLKKQREKLAPKEEESSEEEATSSASEPGTPFDSPEGGVPVLSEKGLKKVSADRMKVGDQFFGERISGGKKEGQLKPVSGSDVRARPDGESYKIANIEKKGPHESTWTVENSKGETEEISFGAGDRKKGIVQDTAENRELMGLTPKSEKSDSDPDSKSSEEAPKDDEQPKEETPETEEAPAEEAKPKVTAKDVDATIRGLEDGIKNSKAISPEKLVEEGHSAGFGLNKDGSVSLDLDKDGKLGWTVKDKNGNALGFVPYADDNRQETPRDELAEKIASIANGESTSKEDDKPESSDEVKSDEETKTESEPLDGEIVEEEQDLVDEAKEEIPEEILEEGSEGTVDVNVKSTIQEAIQDIEDEDGTSWEDLKERTWPVVGAEEDLFIGIGQRSTEDDKFLALYNKDDEELETYDMKGLVNDIDERERAESGRTDSDGGSLDRGDGDAPGGDSGNDENGDRARVTEESQSLIDEVKEDDGEAEGALRKLDDEGYTLAFERNEDTDRQLYILRDNEGNTIARFGRQKEDELADKINNWRDAHRELRRAFGNDKDSDERNVNVTRELARVSAIGTTLEDDNNRYTKISPIAWAAEDKKTNQRRLIDGHPDDQFGKTLKLGHHADSHRTLDEIQSMSDDELRQNIGELNDRIHKIIAEDGKLGDSENLGRRQTDQDQIKMQMMRYDAYAIHDESVDLTRELWNRTKGEFPEAINIGDFQDSGGEAFTNSDGTLSGMAWTKLRNEYIGLDHRTIGFNFELRNSEKPSRAAIAWGNKMDKWAGSGTLGDNSNLYRSILASPDAASEFKAGNVVVDKGIMSTADDPEVAEIYLQNRTPRTAGKIPIMMEIQAKRGEKMTAAEGGADEVVLPRGSKLFIASAEEDANGILRVTARLNPSDAEIAEWTNKSSSDNSEAPKEAPETPESTPEAEVPKTPAMETPSDVPDTEVGETPGLAAGSKVTHPKHGEGTIVRVEGNGKYARVHFDKDDDPKKTYGVALSKLSGEGSATAPAGPDAPAKGGPFEPTQKVGAWSTGERVNHGKHGVGTIQRLEANGEFARVHFDKDEDPKRTYGVKLTKLGKGENGTPSSIKDPSTKVDDQKPKQKVNSGTTDTRNVETDKDGNKFILGKNEAPLYIGATVIHPKFGRGKVVKLENNGKYARVIFDNDPTNTPRGIVGVRLEDASIEKETDRSGFVEKPKK